MAAKVDSMEGEMEGPSASSPQPEDVAGTSTAVPADAKKEERKRRRRELTKKKVKQLEQKLAEYDRQIRKVTEMELSLEEMDSSTSAYLMEDAIKRKFMRTWYRLCELLHMDPEIKISTSSAIDYNGTSHSQLNRRVNRLITMNEFPDHFDVCQLVDRVNEKHSLGLSKENRICLSRKIFKEVGEILQRRRKAEFWQSFGCHLTDSLPELEDPAINDTALHEQLTKSAKEGEERLAQLCEEFAVRQETEGDATDTSGDDDEEAARGKEANSMQVEEDLQSEEEGRHSDPSRSSIAGDTNRSNDKDAPDDTNASTMPNGEESDDIEIVTAIEGKERQALSPESSSDCIIISDSED